MSDYPDACPVCHPGDALIAFPVREPRHVGTGVLADYGCQQCRSRWHTLWAPDGWPLERRTGGINSAQVVRNQRGAALARERLLNRHDDTDEGAA